MSLRERGLVLKPEDIKREVENLRLTLSQAIAQANELHETELELLSSTEVLASSGKKGIPRKEIVELAKELNEVISDLRSVRNKYFILGGRLMLLLKAIEELSAAAPRGERA